MTQSRIQNAPGLSVLAHRVATHGRFKADMLAALGRQPELRALTTRQDSDPSIALIDAWASVLDVLTFYQERIANEGYLRTATERRSVLELARAIGYELQRGVAASTHVVFGLSSLAGSPNSVQLAAGIRVQSVPGPDEAPQTFETALAIEARPEWNLSRPKAGEVVLPRRGTSQIWVRGVSNQIAPGDGLLVVGAAGLSVLDERNWCFRHVKQVTTVLPAVATLDPKAGSSAIVLDRSLSDNLHDVTQGTRVFVFRQRAAVFGYNAPDWRSMSSKIQKAYTGDLEGTFSDWPRFNIAYEEPPPKPPAAARAPDPMLPIVVGPGADPLDTIYLDALYPKLVPGSWVLLSAANETALYSVAEASEASKSDFTLTSKVTRLTLERATLLEDFGQASLREIRVYAQSEALELAPTPLTAPVSGLSVDLDRPVDGLPPGRIVVVTGADADSGAPVSEVAQLASTELVAGATRLRLSSALAYRYRRDSMNLYANVALATHGQTGWEILGSGDASKAFQRFTLKQKPLTQVSAANAAGSSSTLSVRVNDLLWQEVPSLYGCGPSDRVYTTRVADDGTVTVAFGDGVTGARPSSGVENISATYRVGIGAQGNLGPGQLSLLLTRPLGLDSVINPLPASGGADPHTLDEARQNAPYTVLTLDRIVSLLDFENFAAAFAGVGKAQAALVWNEGRQIVHVTIAGGDGAEVPAGSSLLQNLSAALDAARETDLPLMVASYRPVPFRIEAGLLLAQEYLVDSVVAAAQAALVAAFGFGRRSFGQGVSKSEVLAVLQSVEGVTAVDLDALYRSGEPRTLAASLSAQRAVAIEAAIAPAELLTLGSDGISLRQL
jgi:predicted phage baseplate assembly protein